jgi:bifunctional non-homologous end joining protein LigD
MKAVTGVLPTGDGWSYEVKWDGYRVLAEVGRSVRLWSSNGLDATRRFPGFDALAELPGLGHDAVLDGEVVAFDAAGRPSFQALQQGSTAVTYVLFDALRLAGEDLTALPYLERRERLEAAVPPDPGGRWLVSMRTSDGDALAEATRRQGLEGVMAKRVDSPYLPGRRSPAWVKVKHRLEQELVVGGWVPGAGNRAGTFGALLVGYHEGAPLRFAGRVGTGFRQRVLDELLPQLHALERATTPFDPEPPAAVRRVAHWVEPRLVAQVAFGEWTDDGILRHPSFLGLRDDKDPADVVREPTPGR